MSVVLPALNEQATVGAVVASVCSPAACTAVRTASTSGAATTGSEKMLPADARRHLPL